MIGRNFNVKKFGKFSEHNAQKIAQNSLPLPRNRQKTDMISLSYDVNKH